VWHSVVVDSPRYLARMLGELEKDPNVRVSIGPDFRFKTLGDAVAAAAGLKCFALVNCTGLGAGALTGDVEMLSGRGGVAHYPRKPAEDSALSWNCVVMCEDKPFGSDTEPAYVIPRGDVLVVGGSYYELKKPLPRQTSTLPGIESKGFVNTTITDPAELIRLASNRLALAGSSAGPPSLVTPLRTWVGHRPVRRSGIRVELDASSVSSAAAVSVVHNYGHGGSGWTVMHGTAEAAADLVDEALGAPAFRAGQGGCRRTATGTEERGGALKASTNASHLRVQSRL